MSKHRSSFLEARNNLRFSQYSQGALFNPTQRVSLSDVVFCDGDDANIGWARIERYALNLESGWESLAKRQRLAESAKQQRRVVVTPVKPLVALFMALVVSSIMMLI